MVGARKSNRRSISSESLSTGIMRSPDSRHQHGKAIASLHVSRTPRVAAHSVCLTDLARVQVDVNFNIQLLQRLTLVVADGHGAEDG